MIRGLNALLICIGLAVAGANAQRPKKPEKKPLDEFTLQRVAKRVNYHFRFFIDRDERLSCRVSTSQEGQLAFSDLSDLTTALLNSSGVVTGEPIESPRFVLAADPAISLSKVVLTLAQLKLRESQLVELEASDDLFVRVVRRPRADTRSNVMPDPLFLLIQLGRDGDIALNNEPEGKFPATGKLESRLKEIFKAREDNGVFRPGVNETEKTVRVQVYTPGTSFQSLIQLVTAIRNAGSDRIEFDMDGLEPPIPRLPVFSTP